MDIRTKLIFAFVTITLGSMLVLGTLFYRASSEILQSISARQLDSLADQPFVGLDPERIITDALGDDRCGLVGTRQRARNHRHLCRLEPALFEMQGQGAAHDPGLANSLGGQYGLLLALDDARPVPNRLPVPDYIHKMSKSI